MLDTFWKVGNELLMYLIWPFAMLYINICGVKIGKRPKFYGFPKILRTRGSRIIIGDNFEARSWWFSNPLGINHPVILCTWSKDAEIVIGDDVGISGGSIVAATKVEIGNETLVGANVTIIDTDFHPLKSLHRRYEKEGVKSFPVKIGKNVFVGMNAIILKGVNIPDNSIVPAGEVVRHDSK